METGSQQAAHPPIRVRAICQQHLHVRPGQTSLVRLTLPHLLSCLGGITD